MDSAAQGAVTAMPRGLQPGVRWIIAGVTALFIAAVVSAAAALVHTERSEALSQARQRAERFIAGAESTLNRMLLSVDVMLAGTEAQLRPHRLPNGTYDATGVRQQLLATVGQTLLVRDLVLLGADGTVLAAAQSDSARLGLPLPAGFVDAALALPTPQLVASPPLVNFVTSERVLYLARAINIVPESGSSSVVC